MVASVAKDSIVLMMIYFYRFAIIFTESTLSTFLFWRTGSCNLFSEGRLYLFLSVQTELQKHEMRGNLASFKQVLNNTNIPEATLSFSCSKVIIVRGVQGCVVLVYMQQKNMYPKASLFEMCYTSLCPYLLEQFVLIFWYTLPLLTGAMEVFCKSTHVFFKRDNRAYFILYIGLTFLIQWADQRRSATTVKHTSMVCPPHVSWLGALLKVFQNY